MNYDDTLDRIFGAAASATTERIAAAAEAVSPSQPTFVDVCRKCGGSGRFHSYSGRDCGPCFHCKGAGKLVRKTSPERRAMARAKSADRKVAREADNLAAFGADNPAELAWMVERMEGFEFAAAMHEAVRKFGDLTDKQTAAVRNCMLRDSERTERWTADAVVREAAKPAIDTDKLTAAFAAAMANGLKRPILRFEGFTASLAGSEGRNPGAVYLKQGGDYLGKIASGKFHAARDVVDPSVIAAKVQEAMADPLAAAVAYGRATGTCSCCGRELTDPESVARGIGPICASRFEF